MAVNYSQNKIRVVKYFGVSHPLGLIDPVSGMPIQHGIDNLYIVGMDSGNYLVKLGLTANGLPIRKAYPHDISISYAVATGVPYLYPSGDYASYQYGHTEGVMANGVPLAIGSGAAYHGGDGSPHLFSMGGI